MNLKQLYKTMFPSRTPHAWVAHKTGAEHSPEQTCAVCGQHEEWDYGGGHMGGSWEVIRAGDQTKHLISEVSNA